MNNISTVDFDKLACRLRELEYQVRVRWEGGQKRTSTMALLDEAADAVSTLHNRRSRGDIDPFLVQSLCAQAAKLRFHTELEQEVRRLLFFTADLLDEAAEHRARTDEGGEQ